MKMKETSTALRPYEKCLKNGPESLSDEELLAVIIRCGTKEEDSVALSRRILSTANPDNGILNIMDISMEELVKIKGVGKVKAIQVKCIGELSKRIAKSRRAVRSTFTTATDVAEYYMESMRHLKREKLVALMLDSACNYVKEYEVSLGTVNASVASPREIFIEALRAQAVHVILVHNHPSGNPTPSNEDVAITDKIVKAGEIIGIGIIDHIIIGDNTFISFREKGIIH